MSCFPMPQEALPLLAGELQHESKILSVPVHVSSVRQLYERIMAGVFSTLYIGIFLKKQFRSGKLCTRGQ